MTEPPSRKQDTPLLAGGLVRVARGSNQAEAELIHGLLREEGVPSVLRRSAGFDVPDFLAAGPRDVLVSESRAAVAREALGEPEVAPADGDELSFGSRAVRIFVGMLIVGFAGLLFVWVLFQATT
jgi:hypothetical protein